LVDEHATTYENPFKFSGKEHDDITGLYDHGARSRDPKITMWYGGDPLFEKYPDMSPYVYCAGNPVKFIDPDGKNWVKRVYDGVTEIYYDRNVKNQQDVDDYYGKNSGVTCLKDGYTYKSKLGDEFTFYNDHKNNTEGIVYDSNGKRIFGIKPIQGYDYDVFVGIFDFCVNANSLHKNLMGTSYTGADNPTDYKGNDNFDYIPRNKTELGSIVHDHAYDKYNARGRSDALFNTNVVGADCNLALYNFTMVGDNCAETLRRVATGFAFSGIALIKISILGFSEISNGINNLFK